MARLKNQYDFMAGVHVKEELFFNRYALLLDFYTVEDDPRDHNTAMERISYFINEVVQRSVFICEFDHHQVELYEKAGVPTLTVPLPGTIDSIILAVLVTKLNAILEDIIVISDAELTSVGGGMITYVWDSADDDDDVHDIVNDSTESKWWASPGPRFASYPDGLDVAEVEVNQPFPITWKMLALGTLEEEELEDEIDNSHEGTVVKISDFAKDSTKPKK